MSQPKQQPQKTTRTRERQKPVVATTQTQAVNRLAQLYGRTVSPEVAASAAPFYERELSLPAFLESIAREMRAGTWSPVSEACLLFKDMAHEDPAVITVLRWGENDGLMDRETVAALGGHGGWRQ